MFFPLVLLQGIISFKDNFAFAIVASKMSFRMYISLMRIQVTFTEVSFATCITSMIDYFIMHSFLMYGKLRHKTTSIITHVTHDCFSFDMYGFHVYRQIG